MSRLSRRAQWFWFVLMILGVWVPSRADESVLDSEWDFSRTYEGYLERTDLGGRDFEVFEVRGFPIVYIEFPTASVQGEALDRIGIFAESDRYHGKILAPQLMRTLAEEALFDAHDYETEDLARFYSLAARYAIRLHPMEIRIRDLLVRLGFLAPSGEEYVAKRTAALLSAVRGMDERHGAGTRRWVLDHEFRHGFYFVTMRKDVHKVWDDMLSREEKRIIATTLRRTAQYNPDDESLMEREFHAMVFEDRFEDDLQSLWTRGIDSEPQPKKEDVDALIRKLPEIRRALTELEQRLRP